MLAPTYEGVAIIAHTLHFSFNEIMELELNEYQSFLEIASEIAKAKSQSLV